MEIKPTIGVFFGSRSPEHDVSIITATLAISGLKDLGYSVVPVYIAKDGAWYIDESLSDLNFFKDKNYKEKLKNLGGWSLSLEKAKKQIVFNKGGLFKKEIKIDIAFPAIHGRNGEDGTLQGLFELIGVPYVGCGVLSSALAMDKVATKELYEHYGIPTTEFVSFYKKDWNKHKEDINNEIKKIPLPVFVKPARTGSSIGITKVTEEKNLSTVIEVAFHYDSKILVERGINNMADLTCSVIGHSNIEVSLVQESLYSKDMFSYDDKYIQDGGAQTGEDKKSFSIPPQNIETKMLEKIQVLSKNIFELFGCSGIARIDFLYDKDSQKIYANEINTLPGTLYHHLWKETGINFNSLLTKLIGSALERYKEEDTITTSFESRILDGADSSKLANKLQGSELRIKN